jgi:hypothetical protein
LGGLLRLYAVRGVRFIPVLAGVAVLAAAVVPAASSSEPLTVARECGRIEFQSGLEAVFGRFKTHAAADRFRAAVVRNGFQNANIVAGCNEFRVVVRGIESFDVAVDLQAEARRVKLSPAIECIKGKDDVGELEVVFGHRNSRLEAQQLVARAAGVGFTGLQLEADPCGGFEVMFGGFQSRAQAQDFAAEARSVGFDAVIEKS